MKINENLAVTIPTYNRAKEIDDNLTQLIPELKKHNIAVYISDNASTDNTEEVYLRHKAGYKSIFYSRNEVNLGFDVNFDKAIKMSNAKYIWTLGDDDRIAKGAIEIVLEQTKKDYSLIHIEKDKDESFNTITSPDELLSVYGEWCTKISSLIFLRTAVLELDFSKYYGNRFSHWSAFFNYYNSEKLPVLCIHGNLYYEAGSSTKNSASQGDECMWLFCGKFINALKELPDKVYSEESKRECARKISQTFRPKYARLARIAGNFNKNDYELLKDNLIMAVGEKALWKYRLITLVPKAIFSMYEKQKKLEKYLRSKLKNSSR